MIAPPSAVHAISPLFCSAPSHEAVDDLTTVGVTVEHPDSRQRIPAITAADKIHGKKSLCDFFTDFIGVLFCDGCICR